MTAGMPKSFCTTCSLADVSQLDQAMSLLPVAIPFLPVGQAKGSAYLASKLDAQATTSVMVCWYKFILPLLQVDIVPREERDDAAMMPRVPQPMSGAMPGTLHSLECKAVF